LAELLSSTGLTDAGLKQLASHKNLEFLLLLDTKVTEEGVAQLRKALPQCYIGK
jgi:hypothetical protein